MGGRTRIAIAGIGLFLAWLPVVSIPAVPADPEEGKVALSIVVDVTDPSDGRAEVSMTVSGVRGSKGLFFVAISDPEEHSFHRASFTDAAGASIAFERDGNRWELSAFSGETVVARYQVQPGGLGRHGHQGWIGPDWASFDGRIFAMPQGVGLAEDIRVRYDVPQGWTVATPFRSEGDWLVLDSFDRRVNVEALQRSCVGLGPFRESVHTYGDMDLRVYTPESFEAEWADRLHTDTDKLGAWFHETYGFDLGAPFSVVWLPRAPDGDRVWGGAWANGACYEHDKSERHNWLLLGHRFAHPINEYSAAGLMIGPDRDKWFTEGWAAYVEIVGTEATGILDKDQGFNRLYNRYLKEILTLEGTEPPLSQHHVRGDAMREFVHYRKSALTAKILDDSMRERAGVGLDDFMVFLYGKYAHKEGAVDLREELQTFTGVSWDGFWQTHVDSVGGVYPTWDSYVDERIETRLKSVPMAYAGGSPVSATYVHFLARTGDFSSYSDVRDFVVAEGVRRALLSRHGVRLLPDALHGKAYGLNAHVRYRLALAERAYPVDKLPRLESPGCGGSPPPDPPAAKFVPNGKKHASAPIFEEILIREEAYEASLGRSGASRFGIRVGESDEPEGTRLQLSVRPGDPLLGTAEWIGVPVSATWEILRDEKVEQTVTMELEPEWTTSWEKLEGERSKGEAILTLRLSADGELVGERPIWQR